MEIFVMGNGEIVVTPNKITLSFDFKTKEKTYEAALKNGVKNVENYFILLNELGFQKEQIKTMSFRVVQDQRYDERTKKYLLDGYLYTQNANLEFDYDIDKLTDLIDKTSKVSNAPSYRINFNVKDNQKLEEKLLANAYKDAEFQAKSIAKACGKSESLSCKKVSFQPFDEAFSSQTRFDGIMEKAGSYGRSVGTSLKTVLVPEDVKVKKEIYCLFVAE